MSDQPVTLHGLLHADPKMSQERSSRKRTPGLAEERCQFVLVLGRHREIVVVATEALARHVTAVFRAGDPCTVTGFIRDTDWTTGGGYTSHQRVLYADSILRFTPRGAAS